MQFSSGSSLFTLLRFEQLPHQPFHRHTSTTVLLLRVHIHIKKIGKITVLYILLFTFLDGRWEDETSELHGSKH
jgi:hypothetical protein